MVVVVVIVAAVAAADFPRGFVRPSAMTVMFLFPMLLVLLFCWGRTDRRTAGGAVFRIRAGQTDGRILERRNDERS